MGKYDVYNAFDEPYPFYKKGIEEPLYFYPCRMKDYYKINYFAQILIIDKNSMPDAEIISMSWLEFLIKKNDDENNYLNFLYLLLSLVLEKEDMTLQYGFDEKKKPVLIIDGNLYNKTDFDEFRNIILSQNMIEPPDDMIQKELRDKMREADEIRAKNSGNKPASLEDQMVALSVAIGIPIEDVYNMTVRKFVKSIEREDTLMHYKIYLSASMSGFVKFKDKNVIKHWLSEIKKDRFGGLVKYSDFEGNISKVAKT